MSVGAGMYPVWFDLGWSGTRDRYSVRVLLNPRLEPSKFLTKAGIELKRTAALKLKDWSLSFLANAGHFLGSGGIMIFLPFSVHLLESPWLGTVPDST